MLFFFFYLPRSVFLSSRVCRRRRFFLFFSLSSATLCRASVGQSFFFIKHDSLLIVRASGRCVERQRHLRMVAKKHGLALCSPPKKNNAGGGSILDAQLRSHTHTHTHTHTHAYIHTYMPKTTCTQICKTHPSLPKKNRPNKTKPNQTKPVWFGCFATGHTFRLAAKANPIGRESRSYAALRSALASLRACFLLRACARRNQRPDSGACGPVSVSSAACAKGEPLSFCLLLFFSLFVLIFRLRLFL